MRVEGLGLRVEGVGSASVATLRRSWVVSVRTETCSSDSKVQRLSRATASSRCACGGGGASLHQ